MPNLKSLVGQSFGRLTVISRADNRAGQVHWLCVCDCGNQKPIHAANMRNGFINSCGCLRKENIAAIHQRQIKHGQTGTAAYRSWNSAINRCTNPNNKDFHHYGGKGVGVCERWRYSFENFLADMGERPAGTSLDRHPNKNGNYEPENCRWANPIEQRRNSGQRVTAIEHNGISKPLVDWARELGIKYQTARWRFDQGWPIKDVLHTGLYTGPKEAK